MRHVSETKAGRSIAAWIILSPRGKYIARVLAHYGPSTTLVNIFQSEGAAARSAEAAGATAPMLAQSTSASGHGYDKLASALTGLWIDGHKLADHASSEGAPAKPRGHNVYPASGKPAPRGYAYANYRPEGDTRFGQAATAAGWSDCYKRPGLEYLHALGYDIIKAL